MVILVFMLFYESLFQSIRNLAAVLQEFELWKLDLDLPQMKIVYCTAFNIQGIHAFSKLLSYVKNIEAVFLKKIDLFTILQASRSLRKANSSRIWLRILLWEYDVKWVNRLLFLLLSIILQSTVCSHTIFAKQSVFWALSFLLRLEVFANFEGKLQ